MFSQNGNRIGFEDVAQFCSSFQYCNCSFVPTGTNAAARKLARQSQEVILLGNVPQQIYNNLLVDNCPS